jgi:LysR family glycine cleavage system transcriptional activator
LQTGRLVKPFDFGVRRPGDWFFACESKRKDEPHIRVFEEWLVEQVGADADMNPMGATAPSDTMFSPA